MLLALVSLAHAEPRVELSAGVGLPELLHVEAGLGVSPRWTVEARAASTVFNPEVGLGVSAYLLGHSDRAPPTHALLIHGSALLNPRMLSLRSGGDRLAAYLNVAGGYALHADSGFYFRALVGALLYEDSGLAAGPNATVGAGWWFR
jgi:hypothetical protein